MPGSWAGNISFPDCQIEVSALHSVGLSFPHPAAPPGAGSPRAGVPGAQPPAAARWVGRMTSPGRGRGGSGRERAGLLRVRLSARSGSVRRPRP